MPINYNIKNCFFAIGNRKKILYVYIFDNLHKNYVRGIKVSKIYVQKSSLELSISL